MKYIIFIVLLLQTLLFAYSTDSVMLSYNIKSALDSNLEGSFKNSVKSLYETNGYQPLWVSDNSTQQFAEILDALSDPLFNYKYKQFNQDKIIDLSFGIDNGSYSLEQMPAILAKLDILISKSYLQLIYFIRVGDVDWSLVKRKLNGLKAAQDVRATWEIHPRSMPSAKSIIDSINTNNIHTYLTSLIPMENRYHTLVNILNRYRKMPKFAKIPYGKTLKPHKMDSRIREIKKLLKFTGDFPKSASTGTGYGKNLTRAIRSFKERFNLVKGDYIDNKIINYLNTTKEEYIKKILTNLEMLKLYPKSFSSSHVEINVPEFKLRYYQGGVVGFESDIIVGRIDRPTPLFSDKIKYLVLNPTWTITDNLVRRDLIPVLKEHPNYLQEHNIHVFNSYKKGAKEVPLNIKKLFSYEHSKKAIPYRFVQFPGDSNALGRVKFMFPNKYAVYLHDTDNKSLFKYRYRVYSSGCMRVKEPFEFMRELFRDGGANYSESQLQSIFDSNKPTTIKLSRHIPVHVLYQTVKERGGKIHFLYDVYMYDQIVWESMAGHRKSSFRVPQKRLTKIERIGSRIR